MTGAGVDAVLFDKDGTLFDFSSTWDVWALSALERLSSGDAVLMQALADAADYDIAARRFHPTSVVIAGTNREAAEALASALPDRTVEEIEAVLIDLAVNAPLAPAVPLAPLLDALARAGLALGVMTNDTEVAARAHLRSAGVLDRFDFIAGFDSGHGAKPSPSPLLAFADAVGRDPARVAMVGDSAHDLIAGRAAGMRTVGVLTGPATQADLAPLADVVLPDIGHLPGWLGTA
ncbi:HAD family hydrolase [Mesobacterium sp. TK19101]|uniref:phosphoglycolate phosphatase n=1 Tax=Mesobacterium hydrothermale TaxID=3111907 RepID=A0ABU6HJ45_9RHOB|nr:HAD family hydrolase [Mesobacterium sp. TK19101]MEC3861879.1 HAD family hydrolase [Mesobacterium sp. TK19101]